jgi:hypothetical protein
LSELPSVDRFPFGPFSGQSPFGRADGAVVPPFPSFPVEGSVVADGDVDAEGSGLAADTAATPPPTRRRAAIAAVATPRRSPLAVLDGGDSGVSGGACAGAAGSSYEFMCIPFTDEDGWGPESAHRHLAASCSVRRERIAASISDRSSHDDAADVV